MIWSRKEIRYLRENYRTVPTILICRKLGRSVDSVYYKAQSLCLMKAGPSQIQKPKTQSRKRKLRSRYRRASF